MSALPGARHQSTTAMGSNARCSVCTGDQGGAPPPAGPRHTDGQGLGGKKIALQGGDGTEAHLPNPPLPLLGRRAGRGVWAGAALPAVPGGGGVRPQQVWLKMIPTSR